MNKRACYDCKFRRDVPGDTHSRCTNPNADMIALLHFAYGKTEFRTQLIHVIGDPHGIRSGWFNWPINFDPVWLESCNGFERKEVEDKHESTEAR